LEVLERQDLLSCCFHPLEGRKKEKKSKQTEPKLLKNYSLPSILCFSHGSQAVSGCVYNLANQGTSLIIT
jgi:hypothetical protein